MIGCAKRKQWNLVKFVYLIPFYWADGFQSRPVIALYQLIVKPHYWEKTLHGLNLKKEKVKEYVKEAVTETEEKVERNMPFFGFPEWVKVKFSNNKQFPQ